MNLKEAFRYQNFLDKMMGMACDSIINKAHALTVTKTHLKSRVAPDAEDITETESVQGFPKNDDVLDFMDFLIREKEILTHKINEAKYGIESFDIDASVESNKFRKRAADAVRTMMRYTHGEATEQGHDYKFNAEGNQIIYYYDIEIECNENYNRQKAKAFVKDLMGMMDSHSWQVDYGLINTEVKYTPRFDVNDNFEDVMEVFTKELNNK